MSNDVENKTVVTLEMFGSPIKCLGGMLSLNSIREAYLAYIGGANSPASKRICNWWALDSTKGLLDYITKNKSDFGYSRDEDIKATFMGRYYGGTYVCRELAHAYALWLDNRYFAHVLKAFDCLINSNAEHDSSVSLGLSPDEIFNYIVPSLYFEVNGIEIDDIRNLRLYIYDNVGDISILNRMSDSIGLSQRALNDKEPTKSIIDHFKDDPDFPALVDIIKKYYEDHNFAR